MTTVFFIKPGIEKIKTVELKTIPRTGEQVFLDGTTYLVSTIRHFPKGELSYTGEHVRIYLNNS
jgi:hypothetical protein